MAAKGNKRKQQQARKQADTPKAPMTRRRLLVWGGAAVVGAAALGAGGVWAVGSFNRSLEEHDLSRIGQGQPTVVQIHDPLCPLCTALQRETRKALARLEGTPPVYLIADVTRTEGAVFAQRHRVQHVTLMLFDGQGNRVETLTGPRKRDELTEVFARHTR